MRKLLLILASSQLTIPINNGLPHHHTCPHNAGRPRYYIFNRFCSTVLVWWVGTCRGFDFADDDCSTSPQSWRTFSSSHKMSLQRFRCWIPLCDDSSCCVRPTTACCFLQHFLSHSTDVCIHFCRTIPAESLTARACYQNLA